MRGAEGRAERRAVVTALLLVQLFFGLHYFMAKIVLEAIPPRTWAAIRASGAALLLFACVGLLRRRLPRSLPDLAWLALLSIFGVVINQVCFVEGLHRTTPTHSAVINTTMPVETLLFAVMLGQETLDRRKVLSLALSFTGVLLVVRPGRVDAAASQLAGDLLTLVNAFSYALFLVLSKRILARTDALSATAVAMGFGALGILGLAAPQLAAFRPSEVSPGIWATGALIVLFPTAAAYLLSYWALARVDSSVVALFIYLQPLMAAGLSAAFLGERLTLGLAAGATLIFLGVYLALTGSGLAAHHPFKE